jgi:hypothetical protein
MAGCGAGSLHPGPTSSTMSFKGIVHGGPNPVTGATVNLYSTGTGSYGAAGTLLGTAMTQDDGSFAFSGATACSSPKQEYVTVSGGNPGAGENDNYLLMAALGDCSTVSASSVLWVDEVTTVAAAYALSNFISIDTSGSSPVVNIGAPTSNAAATGSCTGTGSSMTCTGAGLVHAFENAMNLANSIGTASTPPTGTAYLIAPSNPNSQVPNSVINTIANILEACVNSTGGTAGDTTTSCGKLFTYTTPPSTSTASPVTPANTLQAVVNLAKYPAMTPANITGLYGAILTQTFYQPTLSAAPTDFSLAIMHSGVKIGSTTTVFKYPYYVTLDINDDVYSINQAASGTGPTFPAAISSNGSSLWLGPQFSTGTTARCSASQPCAAATDSAGHLWVPNTTTSVYETNMSDGTLGGTFVITGSTTNALAVDKLNDIFVSSAGTTGNGLYELPSSGSAFTAVAANGTNITNTASQISEFLAFDGLGNLWISDYSGGGTITANTYLANTGGTTSVTFGNDPVVVTDSTTVGSIYGTSTDSSGNGWTNNQKTLWKTPASPTSATTPTANTITYNSKVSSSARYNTLDGDANVFLPDNNGASSFIWQFFPATSKFVYMNPCNANGGTTCSTTSTAAGGITDATVVGPRNAQVDSTGSIWIASSTNGIIVQIIGTAAPTWSQISYGNPAVRP